MAAEKTVDVAEQNRLNEARDAGIPWKKWGPYLSERQWGTVREDYSTTATPGTTSRTTSLVPVPIKWGEDGLGGISDAKQRLCFAVALLERARPNPEGTPIRSD